MLEAYKINTAKHFVEEISNESIEKSIKKPSNLFDFISGKSQDFVWIDILNHNFEPPSKEELFIMKDVFKIHPLVIEDCVTKKHLPKSEEYKDYNFFILSKMIENKRGELESNKIGFIVGNSFILTYRHHDFKEIDSVKKLIQSKTQDFNSSVDIFYLITDQIIDDYVDVVDSFTTQIYEIEEIIFDTPNSPSVLKDINAIRKNLIILRRNALLKKQIFNDVSLGNLTGLDISKKNPYFKDICDHLDKVLSKIDNQKEYISGILNVQLGLSSQKLNNLIKFLTIISAILLPATLLASIFGMNFVKLPLVELDNGFYTILLIMAFLSIGTFIFFYNKKWL